jgi:hypothetical protein
VAAHVVAAAAARHSAAPAAAAPAEQDDAVAPHAGGFAFIAFLVCVLVRLQPTFDVDLLAFDQVLGQRFGLLAPQVDVVPLGPFLLLAALSFQTSVVAMLNFATAAPLGV